MTKETAITTPMIDLADLLVESVEEYRDFDPIEISVKWDRFDLIRELEDYGVFEE